jgi:hypothetical protein
MDPREKNHKASAGANMKPTLPVPNCCMLNNPTSITIAMKTTAPVNEVNQIIGHPVQNANIGCHPHLYKLAVEKENASIGLLRMKMLISLKMSHLMMRLIRLFR